MIEYVLDTNTVSELMRGRPNASLERRLASRWASCALPAPVVDELQFGVSHTTDFEQFDRIVLADWL